MNPLAHDWFPRPLPRGVAIGEGSWLYSSFAFSHCTSRQEQPVSIGCSSGVYNGCFFDLGPEGQVSIGDYSTLVGAIICTNREVAIGSYVFIAHEVVLADSDVAIPHTGPEEAIRCVVPPQQEPGRMVIADDVWIGAGAVILGAVTIGTGAIIGAATRVDFDVPDHAVVAGNPARIVKIHPGNPGS